MSNLTTKLCSVSFAALAAVCSSTAIALPIGFVDLGSSTVDSNTGLEWLDLSFTEGRYLKDVYDETLSSSGLGADGWRVATSNDFGTLVENFFAIDLSDQYGSSGILVYLTKVYNPSYTRDIEPLINQFVDLFGMINIGSEGCCVGSSGYVIVDEPEWIDIFESNPARAWEWVGGFGIDWGGTLDEDDLILLENAAY